MTTTNETTEKLPHEVNDEVHATEREALSFTAKKGTARLNLADAISSAIAPYEGGGADACAIAIGALRDLAAELHLCWFAMTAANPDVGTLEAEEIESVVYRAHVRAEAAAELVSRLHVANRTARQ